jgi:serine-type D-Ala-D-Ala carboxypeptidase (penicillin-binding protein 5/6)
MRFLIAAFSLFFTFPVFSFEISIGAEEAILVNAKSGKVLYEKNANTQAFPASTTKIATALYALHLCPNLDRMFTADKEALASITPQAKKQSNYRCPPYWLETDSNHVGIKRNETILFKDLLHAALIASANDACNVIAHGLSQSVPKFVEDLNSYLKMLGCHQTHFKNPHGLHHPEHVTTAYDLAIMAKEALKNRVFRKIVSTVRYTTSQTNLEFERTLSQTNSLLKNGSHFYSKAIGIKTGYTQAAGKNLVAAAQNNDRELIAVVLGYRCARSELYNDVIKLFETAFSEPKMRRTLLLKGEQKLQAKVSGISKLTRTYLAESLAYEYYPSEEPVIKVRVKWNRLVCPIARGTVVGIIQVVDESGIVLKETELCSLEEVQPRFWFVLYHFFKNHRKTTYLFSCGAILIFCLLKPRRRKKMR